MAILDILTYPDPLLKQACQPVSEIDADVRRFAADLLETLYHFPGCVGVAAPQTGMLKRIIAIDASRNRKPVENHGLLLMINPVVDMEEGDEIAREGCLSMPDFTANVKRALSVRCRAINLDGEPIEIHTTGFEARVIQHETDHLDGLLFLDRVASLKTDVFRRKRYAVPDLKVEADTTT